MLKFDWLRTSPYACVRTGVWTGWTSVHNNKGKHWVFVVLLVWVYNKALINLEFGPYGKHLLWRHAVRTVRHDITTNIFAYGPHSRLIRAYYLTPNCKLRFWWFISISYWAVHNSQVSKICIPQLPIVHHDHVSMHSIWRRLPRFTLLSFKINPKSKCMSWSSKVITYDW